jgi:hypothetical protein
MASDKKRMNKEALSEIQHVNNEILGSLSGSQPVKHTSYDYPYRTEEQNRRDDFSHQVVTSQFEWKPFGSPQTSYLGKSNNIFGQQENGEVGARLNQEVDKNKNLLKHINHLESELTTLRGISKSHAGTNVTLNEVIEENRYLRSQLAASQTSVPYSIIEELERLKAENQALRKDTVTLLRQK